MQMSQRQYSKVSERDYYFKDGVRTSLQFKQKYFPTANVPQRPLFCFKDGISDILYLKHYVSKVHTPLQQSPSL